MLALALLAAAPLAERIDAAVKSATDMARAHWGALAVRASTGEVLYSRQASHAFVPASNTKLYSTALALERLGPDHRTLTRVFADGPVRDGVLRGDLRLHGGGDTLLSARPVPYVKKANGGDPLGPLNELAAQVASAGVKRVTGDIIGDDTAYLWEPYPDGWSVDDGLYEYGAPVSALTLHDNYLVVRVSPGGGLTVSPPVPYFSFDLRAQRGPCCANKVRLERAPGSRHVEIAGTLGRETALELAVDDPARYAAFAFRDALRRQGIAVDGDVRARHRYSWSAGERAEDGPAKELARRVSPPLIEALKTVNKVSQNLHAEIVLREVARCLGREPSRRGGLGALGEFLAGIGVDPDSYKFSDGSGLSRLTLTSPDATVKLLRHMDRPIWRELLPLGGEDGTLSARYKDFRQGRVMAKTGTLSHVGALSGYLVNAAGESVVFSIMVNNANASGSAIRSFIDKIVVELAE